MSALKYILMSAATLPFFLFTEAVFSPERRGSDLFSEKSSALHFLGLSPSVVQEESEKERRDFGKCEHAGTVYAEGSAMESADDCTLCYCIRGERLCVTTKCNLPAPGCKPRFRSNSCCPTFYDCNSASVTTTTKTTTTPTTTTTTPTTTTTTTNKPEPNVFRVGCFLHGLRYFEGQYIPEVGGLCSSCYCLRGQTYCTEKRCPQPIEGCLPIYTEGRCCPIRYECDKKQRKHNSKFAGDLNSPRELRVGTDIQISDFDPAVLENHVRIERQSDADPVEEGIEEIATDGDSSNVATDLPEPPVAVEKENLPVAEPEPAVPLESVKADVNPEEKLEETSIKKETAIQPPKDSKTDVQDKVVDGQVELRPSKKRINDKEIKIDLEVTDDDKNKKPNIPKLSGKTDIVDKPVEEKQPDQTVVDPSPPKATEATDGTAADKKPASDIPLLSLRDLLLGLRHSEKEEDKEEEEEVISSILPNPIVGTTKEHVGTPLQYEEDQENDQPLDEFEYPSYDVNVGASLFAGDQDTPPGIGQVFPVDLEEPEQRKPTQSKAESPPKKKTPSQPSFLDTFLNLFTGTLSKDPERKTESKQNLPPKSMAPPPPIANRHPPVLLGMRPPPPPLLHADDSDDNVIEAKIDNTKTSSFVNDFSFDGKRAEENELKAHELPPPLRGTVTRNELPIVRRPPSTHGERPSRPSGIFAARPNIPIGRQPPFLETQPLMSDDNLENVKLSQFIPEVPPRNPIPSLPSDPEVEEGFPTLKESPNETRRDDLQDGALPPSLPNLEIIPFVAADAVFNEGGVDTEDLRTSSRPLFGLPPRLKNCREGGKIWANGETVARGDGNPCVVCRCLSGKVICQNLECPKLPPGCTSDAEPEVGECCPKITCDESANVSIVDTLPIFTPISEEEEEHDASSDSKPRRPSPLSFGQARRPPFIPPDRMPKLPPIISEKVPEKQEATFEPAEVKRPFIPPRFRHTTKPEPSTNAEHEKEQEKTDDQRKPVRPNFIRPSPFRPAPSRTSAARPEFSKPPSNRPSPGTRPAFIPPRRQATTRRPILFPYPTEDQKWRPETSAEVGGFSNLRSEVLVSSIRPSRPSAPNEEAKLPSFQKFFPSSDSEDDKFIPPHGFLLPKPIPTTRPVVDEDIINFVLQDKFRLPPNQPLADVRPKILTTPPPTTTTSTTFLPEIPEEVKAQLPLGNDPILALGLLELGGCNVYGRMYDVGEEIKELSARCKACRCTKVGVQCLPIC